MRAVLTGATGFIGSAIVRSCFPQATRCWAWRAAIRRPKRWRGWVHGPSGELADTAGPASAAGPATV